ncbi:MAG: hypothetical protein QM500_11135 [Methylococcales bacterium]
MGEKQELVYNSQCNESTAVYYGFYDINKQPFSGYDIEKSYNFSFDNLYRSQIFRKDPGSTDNIGTKANRFHIFSYLSVTIGLLVFCMAGSAIYNTFIYPVYISAPTDVNLSFDCAQNAFDQIISGFQLSRGWLYKSKCSDRCLAKRATHSLC